MFVATTFLTFLWTLIVIFFMVVYFMILFHVIVDLFRRKDASGGKKALWIIFLLFFPLVGLLAYLIANSQSMGERDLTAAKESQQQFDDYVRGVSGGATAEIAKAKELRDSGAITDEEFEQIKAKALAS